MCGFAGLLTTYTGTDEELKAIATRMAAAVQHRGPDDVGVWTDAKAGIALSHRRLSIIDLSAAGHQPMHSAGGRFVIAYNGEVYNHLDMRAELEATGLAPAWQGHSDTETLLAAFEHWGLDATLTRTVGMFAFALWDTHTRTLHLARDRFGEKPLYYGWVNGTFVFGSELKALRAYPDFGNLINREALALYMRFCYVPAPHSIYQDIYKLEPGCALSIESGKASKQDLAPRRWWSLASVVESGAKYQVTDEVQAVLTLEQCLKDAVRLQSLADVPLGAFLSGGVDSSAIVALMQAQSTRPVKTFTVGFEEAGFDESPYARAVAEHLGTEHTELFVTAKEAQGVIHNLPMMYDEPFADSSQIPTHLVCRAARQQVTVALSGDAGDELFGGYNRYVWGPRIWDTLAWLPYSIRQTLAVAATRSPSNTWDQWGHMLGVARCGERLQKLGRALHKTQSVDDIYHNLVSEWRDPAQVVKVGNQYLEAVSVNRSNPNLNEPALRMMYRDSMTYLPDDILCKVDRAAMAVSLETRVPFLDHRVAELAWQLPLDMKIRDGQGKWALRQVLYQYVPKTLIERPKAGFSIPIGQWLRGPLRDWAESLLSEQRLESEGYFYPAPIRAKWAAHLTGRHDHTASLWTVLMFQSWLESND